MEISAGISHDGIVENTGNGFLIIRVHRNEVCGNCNSQKKCIISNSTNNTITIPVAANHTFKVGDPCLVKMKQQAGYTAVFYAYLLPFLVLFSTLVVVYGITKNELAAAISALSSLIPYYYFIYLIRKRISKKLELYVTRQL